nr:immunoglobulin light chain junction region [Macaca mulatta]MOW29018.1 immunoglobulin light chain junction region [Macaca mulatta]
DYYCSAWDSSLREPIF